MKIGAPCEIKEERNFSNSWHQNSSQEGKRTGIYFEKYSDNSCRVEESPGRGQDVGGMLLRQKEHFHRNLPAAASGQAGEGLQPMTGLKAPRICST